MKKMRNLVCPISTEIINERVTRANALLTIILAASGFIFSSVLFFVFLMADFYIRAFTSLKYSPISYLSSRLVNALNIGMKPTGKAQKIFAARMGFIMSLVITILFLLNLNLAALIIGGILVFFASLEFALGICVGCMIYTYFVLPFYK